MFFKTFNEDRPTIENKFHIVGQPFDGYKRRATHGYAYDSSTGLSDEEIIEGLRKLSQENEGVPHPIAKARAVAYSLANTRIDVNESDYFVGFYSTNRLISETTVNKWSDEIFKNVIPEVRAEMDDYIEAGTINIWPDFDHVVPGWDSIFSLGFRNIRERARKYREMHRKNGTLTEKMDAHFEGIEIQYTAILDIIERFYKLALTRTHDKAPKVAACLKHLHEGAPTDIYEAMQLIYIYFIISDDMDYYQVRSLGHGLDSSLLPFYEKDLAEGRYTRDEIREFLAYFLMQWSAIGNIMGQPLYLAGTNEDGSTKVTDLTYDIIDVYDELKIYDPKIQIKINTNTPEKFVYKILDMIRRGQNSFVFCFEPGMTKAVMGYGATEKEAREIDIRGCYATGVRANEVTTTTGYVNAVKAVEYVFSDGVDSRTGKQLGAKTGALSEIESFEDFYMNVLKQWTHLIERTMAMANAYEVYFDYVNPSSMYSATIEGSLKKGVDCYAGGAKFNNSEILCCSFANLINSVMAVKEFVFDKKKVTLEEMKAAMDADWVGYEKLQSEILKSNHKFGNGDAEADMYTTALGRYFAFKVNNTPNARGGIYKCDLHSAYMFVWQGEKTMATPDGRKAGQELAKNATPSPGTDRNGVTALVRSLVELMPYNFPESCCVDVMLHPSATVGEEGLVAMKALLDTYMAGGGMSMQFNIFDANVLRDAQKHPEKYQTLQVRVSGWNAYWNDLSRAEQDGYILRAENVKY